MKKVIPFGNRILVKRRKVGEKIGAGGIIIAPDRVKDSLTDLADVVYVPDFTFGDKEILDNADKIITALTQKAVNGDNEALLALLQINNFVKIKSLKPGDSVMISKYVGTDFTENDGTEQLTLVNQDDIIGMVINEQ